MSDELDEYLTLKRFWNNLGLTYSDILKLPNTTFEIYKNIMSLEEQYSEREMKKSYAKRNSNPTPRRR